MQEATEASEEKPPCIRQQKGQRVRTGVQQRAQLALQTVSNLLRPANYLYKIPFQMTILSYISGRSRAFCDFFSILN